MKLRLSLLFFLLSSIASFVLFTGARQFRAQTAKAKPALCCGAEQAVGPRELDFPYYSLRDGFNSTLYLVSDSPSPTALTIAVRNLAGQAVLSTANIQPQQRLTIDLRTLILQQGADPIGSFAEGSVAVYFTGTIMPVVGQITMSNPVTHLVHESEMLENDPGRTDIPAVLNGLWWGLSGGRDARIVVSNTRGQSVVADVFLDFLGQSHPVAKDGIAFMPHETKVLSVTDMLGGLGFSPAQVPEGGITIVARGAVGGLMAQGKILDPVTGFSTTLRFPSPDSQVSNALHAVGIPIGKPSNDSPFAAMGVFIPHVVLRNTTNAAQTVTLTLEYPQGALAEKATRAEVNGKETGQYREFDGEAGDSTAQLSLPPISLPAYSTEDVSLLSALGQLPLPLPYASVRIQYTGAAGGVIAEVASVDESNDLVVDSHVVNEGWGWAGSGANPFHLDDQTESILFLTDMGDKPVRMGFFATAGGVNQVLTQLRLDPHETRAINLRKFRDAQRKDFKGHLIAADASDGTVTWLRLDNVPVAGRVVVISRHGGMASNYDCCICMCPATYYNYSALDVCAAGYDCGNLAQTVGVAINGTYQLYAFAEYLDCNGVNMYSYDVTHSGSTGWYSSYPSVATVSHGNVTGVSAGQTAVSASYTDCAFWDGMFYPDCQCDYYAAYSGDATVNVGDGTPVISNISNTDWPVGTTTTGVNISGYYFGTNPTVNFSDSSGVTCTKTYVSDQLITCTITVSPNDSAGSTTVTVTSTGYNGSGFISEGGSVAISSPTPPANLPKVSCGTATRGDNVTCTVRYYPVGSGPFTWSFKDGGTNTVTSSPTTDSWPGKVVQTGTVSVTWPGLLSTAPTAALTVNARTGWAFTAVSPNKVANGGGTDACAAGLPVLTSPPTPSSNMGKSCLANCDASYVTATVSGGPNDQYKYNSSSGSNSSLYQWERVPDLENTSGTFYVNQTGTYSAQSDPSGCISGGNLASQTQRHEIGLAQSSYIQSHWIEYKSTQDNSANNYGTIIEGKVGLPSAPVDQFQRDLNTTLTNAKTAIGNAFQVEPYGVDYNEYDAFLGWVNFPPSYNSCQ